MSAKNKHDFLEWKELKNSAGTIPAFLRAEVLESDEHVLYVFSHESFELKELSKVFEARGGTMTYAELAYLIEPEVGGAIHEAAGRHGDEVVARLRHEKGIDP